MEREEERERRRMRDRQRRQSMTKEQRERHLARRRINYQLRRQRAANAAFVSQCLTPSTSSHQPQSSQILQGSSVELQGFPKRLRLNIIKRLARNLGSSMSVPPGSHQVAPQLISGSNGDGNTTKPLRLNRVKRLARSLSFPSQQTQLQNATAGVNGMENEESLQVITSENHLL